MKIHIEYDVTWDLQKRSVQQYFFKLLLYPQLPAFGVLAAAAIAMIIVVERYRFEICGVVLIVATILVSTWVKSYSHVISAARQGLKLIDSPKVEVDLLDDLIEYRSSTGTRRYTWDKVEWVCESKDFIIFMNERLPLLSLPRACFTPTELKEIRTLKPSAPKSSMRPRVLPIFGAVFGIIVLFATVFALYLWTKL